jgi:hypothetical protein
VVELRSTTGYIPSPLRAQNDFVVFASGILSIRAPKTVAISRSWQNSSISQ